jgi:hypothetical protein
MLVHRDNDDHSGGNEPHKATKSAKSLTTSDAAPAIQARATDGSIENGASHLSDDPALPDAAVSSGAASPNAHGGTGSDEGKTHMIGDALKSVYQRTLEEDIPDDFLDLLKQLK